MMKPILQLGDPRLYQISNEVQKDDKQALFRIQEDLHDTLFDYRREHGIGRAIAAPQINIFKRIIYLHIDKPILLINPHLAFPDTQQQTLWDDCMSIPNLEVRVSRFLHCTVDYDDIHFEKKRLELSGDLAELVQHEYDHLDGILATMRAIDNRSFRYRKPDRRNSL